MRSLNVAIVYIFLKQGSYPDYARRFVDTYKRFDPGYDHSLIVVCNDCEPDELVMEIFKDVRCFFEIGDNIGKDIGAYISIAHCIKSDVMVCLGSYVHFKKSGWLKRLMEAWEKYGEGMYGFFGNYQVSPHLQTGAFCTSARLLREYPIAIHDGLRYEFEYGTYSFWHYVHHLGLPVLLVTWDGEWTYDQWRIPRNGFRNGDQSNCLLFHNHTDGYEFSPPTIKRYLESESG